MVFGKATKKPIPIDFMKYKGAIQDVRNWVTSLGDKFNEHFLIDEGALKVRTLEGSSYDVPNPYVILRGVKGEYYPCDPEVFAETYDIKSESIV